MSNSIKTIALLSLLTACSVYEKPGNNIFGVSASGVGADSCPYPEANILNSLDTHIPVRVQLNSLADDIQACGKLTGFDGPDGVVGIELGAGEAVHVSAQFVSQPGVQAPPVDVGVYMMGQCDPSTCLKRVERCPEGLGEQFVWSNEQQGTYYFGFDTKAYDQTLYEPELEIDVSFPQCGDRVIEPGESCDDGNRTSLDGCSDNCQAELIEVGGVIPVEVEPNNYYKSGNVLITEVGKPIRIKGHIGGSCDLDFFFVDIPEGGFATARLLGEDGQECPAGSPELILEFDDPSGAAELGKAKIPAQNGGSNHCPQWGETSFVTTQLPKGRYVIEMKPPNKGVGMEPFPYVLEVEVVALEEN